MIPAAATGPYVRLALPILTLAGFLLRAWGISFGLPLQSNLYIRPDESLIVASAAQFWDNAGHPGFFAYPALMIELCALLYLPWNFFSDGSALAFGRDPSPFFLIARWLSVIAGTASILLVYRITAKLATAGAALIAAALFAVAPLAVRDSHFGVTDTLLIFLLLAAMAWPTNSGRVRDVAIIGAIYGLACSTKFSAALLAPALASRILLETPRDLRTAARNLMTAGLTCAFIFAALNPYLFTSGDQASGQALGILGLLYGARSGGGAWSPAHAAMQLLRPLRYGPASYVGAALALLALPLTRSSGLLPIAAAAAAFGAALLPSQQSAPYRYALPMLPFLAILAACGIDRLTSGWLKTISAIALTLPGAWHSIQLDRILARTDTRSLAGVWIRENIDPQVPILILGPPESEPQIQETAASIRRRVDYVHGLYGQTSGDIVSIPYRLMGKSASDGPPAREVYRGTLPSSIDTPAVLVVTPSSPHPIVRSSLPFTSPVSGIILQSIDIPATKQAGAWQYDAVDAFFLPFHPLEAAIRPGPSLRLDLIRR